MFGVLRELREEVARKREKDAKRRQSRAGGRGAAAAAPAAAEGNREGNVFQGARLMLGSRLGPVS